MRILLLTICLAASNAMAWEYVYPSLPAATDIYITQNLIRLSEKAEQDKIDAFFKRLGCWTEVQGSTLNVVCRENGQQIKWRGEPQIEEIKPIYIMVPADGVKAR